MKFFFTAILCFLFSSVAISKEILLTDQNTVTLRGPVNASTVAETMQKLSELNRKGTSNDPIYLVLLTPGGSVYDGLSLIEYMNSLKRPVHSIAIMAASMGFHILQNSKERYITKYGTIMSHRANGGVGGDIPQQVNSRLKHINDILEKMDSHVISRTNGKYNKSSYGELIRDEYWAVGSNAVDDSFVDGVAAVKCDDSLNKYSESTFQTLFGTFKVSFSNCPLITLPLKVSTGFEEKFKNYMTTIRKLEL